MAKRKQKVIIKPMSAEIKSRFERLIHTGKKDALKAKYDRIASKSIFKTDEDLRSKSIY